MLISVVGGKHGLFQSVLLKEVLIEPNVKLECVPKFCYLGDTLGAGGSLDEAARARVRCFWAKFKELSPILTARSASHRMKGKIFRACVQSLLTYGTETWAMKAENLHSLERAERVLVRWICVVCLWRIGSEKRSCTVFWVFKAWQKWWGMVDWGSLGMWNVRTEMIGWRPVEIWWWQGWDMWAGVKDVRPRGLASASRPEISASALASASRVQASASRVQT